MPLLPGAEQQPLQWPQAVHLAMRPASDGGHTCGQVVVGSALPPQLLLVKLHAIFDWAGSNRPKFSLLLLGTCQQLSQLLSCLTAVAGSPEAASGAPSWPSKTSKAKMSDM